MAARIRVGLILDKALDIKLDALVLATGLKKVRACFEGAQAFHRDRTVVFPEAAPRSARETAHPSVRERPIPFARWVVWAKNRNLKARPPITASPLSVPHQTSYDLLGLTD
jgi:hypothetical protein